jgi:SAM-dependent methyltransferase
MLSDSRYDRERTFHDASTSDRWSAVSQFYETASASLNRYHDLVLSRCSGMRVLEYGCGQGETAIELADHGAVVNGIDISPWRIERAREFAGTRKDVSFEVMNAEALRFDDNSFDMICGVSILHHLDLGRAYPELARTLRPEGTAVFLEPLGHNAFINLYRRMTPQFRTPDEHPFVTKDFTLARAHFHAIDVEFYHLTSLIAFPFRRFGSFRTLLRGLDSLDQSIFARFPSLRKYAWIAIVSLAQPCALHEGKAMTNGDHGT